MYFVTIFKDYFYSVSFWSTAPIIFYSSIAIITDYNVHTSLSGVEPDPNPVRR